MGVKGSLGPSLNLNFHFVTQEKKFAQK